MMKKCPNCNTVYSDMVEKCSKCNVFLSGHRKSDDSEKHVQKPINYKGMKALMIILGLMSILNGVIMIYGFVHNYKLFGITEAIGSSFGLLGLLTFPFFWCLSIRAIIHNERLQSIVYFFAGIFLGCANIIIPLLLQS